MGIAKWQQRAADEAARVKRDHAAGTQGVCALDGHPGVRVAFGVALDADLQSRDCGRDARQRRVCEAEDALRRAEGEWLGFGLTPDGRAWTLLVRTQGEFRVPGWPAAE